MGKPIVMVVESNPHIRSLIRGGLPDAFDRVETGDGQTCLQLLTQTKPCLVMLDVLTRKPDGWSTLKRIRTQSDVPLFVLMPDDDATHRVRALNMGADDCILPTMDRTELAARIDAVLRRKRCTVTRPALIRHRNLVLDPLAQTATWQGRPLTLTPTEYDLLMLLAAHPGEAISRKQLIAAIWGDERISESRSLDRHVMHLRSKLGDSGNVIATVRGVGYRFDAT